MIYYDIVILSENEEILFYVIAMREDELHSNTITALHRATDDLLPEVRRKLQCYIVNTFTLKSFPGYDVSTTAIFFLGYEEAAKHYLTKTLPKTA